MAKHRLITKPWYSPALDASQLVGRHARTAFARASETPRLTVGALAVAVASATAPGVTALSTAPAGTTAPTAEAAAHLRADGALAPRGQDADRKPAASNEGTGSPESGGGGSDQGKTGGDGEGGNKAGQAPEGGGTPAPAADAPAPAPAPEPEKPRATGTQAWIDEATSILAAHGVPEEKMKDEDIAMIIKHESNGNPKAINLWDSNARKGIPSKGLMQTIDPTFNAHALPGHKEIYNPVDNIIAGVRYSISRYGSVSNVPGVKLKKNGKGYKGY